jgi:hypothetical protein
MLHLKVWCTRRHNLGAPTEFEHAGKPTQRALCASLWLPETALSSHTCGRWFVSFGQLRSITPQQRHSVWCTGNSAKVANTLWSRRLSGYQDSELTERL